MRKQTYEFEEWEEGRDAYIVIVEWIYEHNHEDLRAVFVSKWSGDRQGKRWPQKRAQAFVDARRAKLLEAVHDVQQSQYEKWSEQQEERRGWRSVFS